MISAHDFSKASGDGGFCFSGNPEDIVAGLDKFKAAMLDGSIVVREVHVKSSMVDDDFTTSELVIHFVEKEA